MTTRELINALRSFYATFNATERLKQIFDFSPLELAADRLEELEKQSEAMIKKLCDKEDLVREAEGRFYELEKELDTLKNAKKPEPEWISVEDEPIPGEQSYIFTALPKIIIKRNPVTGEPAYWMRLEPPQPKMPTFKDVFLEKFPKTESVDGRPAFCIRKVFPYVQECNFSLIKIGHGCKECWYQPYFEEEGGEE